MGLPAYLCEWALSATERRLKFFWLWRIGFPDGKVERRENGAFWAGSSAISQPMAERPGPAGSERGYKYDVTTKALSCVCSGKTKTTLEEKTWDTEHERERLKERKNRSLSICFTSVNEVTYGGKTGLQYQFPVSIIHMVRNPALTRNLFFCQNETELKCDLLFIPMNQTIWVRDYFLKVQRSLSSLNNSKCAVYVKAAPSPEVFTINWNAWNLSFVLSKQKWHSLSLLNESINDTLF